MMKTRVNLILILVAIGLVITTEGQTLEEFLENQVTSSFMPQSKAVGLGLTVVNKNGTIRYANGFGFRDIEANASADSKSLFAVGSIAKSFTGILVLKTLNEKFPDYGEQVLNIPIKQLVAPINFTLSDRYRTESATFKDLLCHRSCLSDHLMGVVFGAINSFDEYVYRSRYETEVCPFRGAAAYSNSMVALAGDIVSKLTGHSFENLMHDFFNDLGMTDSRMISLDEDYDALDNMVHGYYINGDGILTKSNSKILRQVACENPSGGVLTTADDMTKFMHFVLNDGENVFGQQIVLKEIMTQWILRPDNPLSLYNVLGTVFQMETFPIRGLRLSHAGNWAPYISYVAFYPALGYSIFTSSNGPGSDTPFNAQFQLHDEIIEFLTGTKETLSEKNLGFRSSPFTQQKLGIDYKSMEVQQVRRASCSLMDVIGNYGNALDGEVQVVNQDSNLKLFYGIWGEGNLIQNSQADCLFDIEWISDIVVFIYSGLDGQNLTNAIAFHQTSTDGPIDLAVLEIGQGSPIIFERDLILDNLPEIPYDPESCTAENFYG